MNDLRQENKEIKVCSGAGCKAWASESIVRELEGHAEGKIRVCRVACMKKCGGGANVKVSSMERVIKMRQPEEVLRIFFPEAALASMV